MFDILNQSALEISQGILAKAWGGKAPEGGLDFPSACTLSRSAEEDSDLHVEFGYVPTEVSHSDLPWLADVTHTETRGPGDTNSPFKHPIGEAPPPGIFGSALSAYGEVVATCREFGRSEERFDGWFREQWGIDEQIDLEDSIPIVRSHGDAFWGGVGRKLAPGVYMNPAATKQLKVVWHGKNRQDYGEHTLVDWPRLEAIALATGSALLLEDRHAKGRIKRIDFKLVRKELPKSPGGLGNAIERLPKPAPYQVRDISKSAIEFVQGFRKQALILSRNALGEGGALDIDEGFSLPIESLVKFVVGNKVQAVQQVNFLDMAEASFDIQEPAPNIDVTPIRDANISIYDAFSSVTRPFVDKFLNQLPEGWQIRTAIQTYTHGIATDREAAAEMLNSIVAKCVPDDFLLRVYRLYSIIFKDREKGGNVVVSLLKALRAPHNIFETKALIAAGIRVKRNARCVVWLCDSLAASISRAVKERGQQASITGVLRRIMSSAANGDIALAEIIRKRRNFWANEYRRRATTRSDRKVEYQVKSRLFRVTLVVASSESGVYIDYGDRTLGNVLESSAAAYMRKRKGFNKADPDPPEQGHASNVRYCQILDDHLKPKVTYSEIWASYQRSAELLKEDVEEILEFCADDCSFGRDAPDGDLDDTLDEDLVPTPELSPEPAPVEEPIVDIGLGDEEEDLGDMFGDEDDEDFEVREQVMDLAKELHMDHPEIDVRLIAEFAAKYGEIVTVSQYDAISREIREVYLRTEISVKEGGDLEGFDIRDV